MPKSLLMSTLDSKYELGPYLNIENLRHTTQRLTHDLSIHSMFAQNLAKTTSGDVSILTASGPRAIVLRPGGLTGTKPFAMARSLFT